MKISVWPNQISNNGVNLYQSMMSYIRKTDTIEECTYDADAALIWSVLWNGNMSGNKRVWDHYRANNKPVIVIEVGGLVRDQSWRLSINGINRSATFPYIERFDYNRPKMFNLNILPWHSGDYILICGQHGKSEQWRNMPPMDQYFQQTVTKVREYTDRPIVIRAHPRFRENLFFKVNYDFYSQYNVQWNTPKQIQKTYDSFDLEPMLAHCHCAISHSSNSGLTSIIHGTPAIVSAESLAYDVAEKNITEINNLKTPNRDEWLVELCHKEWFEHELEYAWLNLRKLL